MSRHIATSLVRAMENLGVLDVILPFILIFTISFAVMNRISLFGEGPERRKYAGIISLVLALLIIVPHVRGNYPFGFDPIDAINTALPSVSLVLVAAVMLLLVLGVFGQRFAVGMAPIVGILSVLFVLYIFGSAIGWWSSPSDVWGWWSSEVTILIIIILVFAGVIYMVVAEPTEKSAGEGLLKGFKNLFRPL